MGELFKPWRRKHGVVTLLVACVFMVGWARSYDEAGDQYWIDEFSLCGIVSANGHVYSVGFSFEDEKLPPVPIEFQWTEVDTGQARQTSRAIKLSRIQYIVWTVPYWPIVVPLTLLSAWLLLSSPRIATPKSAITAPVPD